MAAASMPNSSVATGTIPARASRKVRELRAVRDVHVRKAEPSDLVVVPPLPSSELLDSIELGVTPCVVAGWVLDPANALAPSLDAWWRMTEQQREFTDS